MVLKNQIDISENTLRNRGRVLDVLLADRTLYKPSRPHNIIWATDSYQKYGKNYAPTKQIKREQVTGANGRLIQPRAAKSIEEQKYRTKDKAEVFTPLKIVKKMNMAINWASGQWIRRLRALPGGALWVFAIKQAWAALFGGVLLIAIIVTNYVQLPWFARYDWLFIVAVLTQIGMVAFRLERPREVVTIVAFHLIGLGMELFKTSSGIGSWSYPEESVIRLGAVPLFSGFMYGAVGSYISRSWRVMRLRFTGYPPRLWTAVLAILIYVNFFTHHFIVDIRILLFLLVVLLYWRTKVFYVLVRSEHSMPMLVAFALIASVIWLAENISTFANVWLYPYQMNGWQLVGIDKIGAWLLLMIISFIFVELLHWAYREKGAAAYRRRIV